MVIWALGIKPSLSMILVRALSSVSLRIAETLSVEKVYVNIEEFDCDDLCMYRCIGDIIDSSEDLMFKVSFLGGEREDILKVEKMIIDFINEVCDNDSDNSDNESDNDSDNDSVQSDNDDGNESD